MMSIIKYTKHIPTMSIRSKELVTQAEKILKQYKQEVCETWHTIHNGIYTRNVLVKAGNLLVGTEIKVPTTLTISGDILIYTGEDIERFKGFHTLPSYKGRKQLMRAITDTYISMSFSTTKTTIEEVEEEFTDDVDSLMSRMDNSINHINITVGG